MSTAGRAMYSAIESYNTDFLQVSDLHKVLIREVKCTLQIKMSSNTAGRAMYLAIEPYNTDFLQVSDLHKVYYEQSGNQTGNPVIFLHGGPGGGCSARDRQFFDPSAYRIILMDQRGSGKSLPPAELKENTTWHLISDIEKLREHLGIEKWVVFGGSWGSTLSLAYAQKHPDKVKALILRGIFTLRRRELLWFYQDGASMIFPDAWEEYIAPIPEVEHGDLMSAYYRKLTGDDDKVKYACAKAWSKWEMATSRLYIDPEYLSKVDEGIWALQFARIECHYFINGGFFSKNGQLLDKQNVDKILHIPTTVVKGFFSKDGQLLDKQNVDKIRHIPTTIVQGRYDLVCPMETAWKLHKAFPEADFHVISDAGHSNKETGVETKLLDACDKYRNI